MTHDIFISYSIKDMDTAHAVCHALEQNNFKCWIAPRNIHSKNNYADEIMEGLLTAKIVVLVFSKNSQKSSFVNNEINVAFSNNKPIISFSIDEYHPKDQMKYFLKNNHWLDAYPNPEEHFETLIADASRLLFDEVNVSYINEGLFMNFNEFDKFIPKQQNSNEINYSSSNQGPDVFISYSEEDKFIANRIYYLLEKKNFVCWISPRNIISGFSYHDQISNAIESAKVVVLVFSQFSQESTHVKKLIKCAVGMGKKIVSINVDNSNPVGEIEGLLCDAFWIDAYESKSDLYDFVNFMMDDVGIMPSQVNHRKEVIVLGSDIILGDNEVPTNITLSRDNLVIDGNGHTIDAQGKTLIFYCTGKNITIKNITLKNGHGAISNYGGELTIQESTITQNSSDYTIFNYEGSLKFFNCEFLNNKSSKSIIYNEDYLEIYNSAFLSNQSENVIVNENEKSSLGVFNGKFKDNKITKVIIFNSGKHCFLEKIIFENNLSEDNSQSLIKTIKKYVFKNNLKNIINQTDLTLAHPIINDAGKTVLNMGNMFIKSSSHEFLSKIHGKGTIQTDMNSIPKNEKFDFGYLDKKIHDNQTNEIILDKDICLEVYEKDFYEGGIELDIDNLIIDGNGKTIDGADKSRIFIITGNNVTLKNIIFKNGHSHKNYDTPLNNNGGAIKINHNAKLILENCKFINNVSEENGGVIHNSGELNISESHFNKNITKNMAGVILNDSELTIVHSDFNNNDALIAGVIWNGGKLTIFESNFNNNSAIFVAGAIFNQGELSISESVLNNNTSNFFGGAICNSGKLSIFKSSITKNMSKYLKNFNVSTLNIHYEKFFYYLKNCLCRGGAIMNNYELIIKESNLNENTSELGGAIYNGEEGVVNIIQSLFKENIAEEGGAIHNNDQGFLDVSKNPYLDGGTLTITESTFNKNKAKEYGGAIYIKNSSIYKSDNCTFKNNKPDDVYGQKE